MIKVSANKTSVKIEKLRTLCENQKIQLFWIFCLKKQLAKPDGSGVGGESKFKDGETKFTETQNSSSF